MNPKNSPLTLETKSACLTSPSLLTRLWTKSSNSTTPRNPRSRPLHLATQTSCVGREYVYGELLSITFNLPPELLLRVANAVCAGDMPNFHLVCEALKDASFAHPDLIEHLLCNLKHSMLLTLPRELLCSLSSARTKSSWSVNSVERHIVARIAGGSSKIERKVLEPQVAIDPPWSYIMDDDKKQDAPIVISDDEDDDVVIISETHTRKSRRHVSVSDDQLIQAPAEDDTHNTIRLKSQLSLPLPMTAIGSRRLQSVRNCATRPLHSDFRRPIS